MIELPYPPSANVYWRMVQPKNGRARMVVSAEARAYKATVRTALLKAGVRPLDGAVTLTVRLYRPQKSGDLDNRLKVLGDSLNGLAWHDDEQVVEIHAYRLDDKARPRVEVDCAAPLRFFAPAPVPKEFLRANHNASAPKRALVEKNGTPKTPSGKWNKTKVAAFNQDTPPIAHPPLGFATGGGRLPRPAYIPPRSTGVDAAKEAEATFAPKWTHHMRCTYEGGGLCSCPTGWDGRAR